MSGVSCLSPWAKQKFLCTNLQETLLFVFAGNPTPAGLAMKYKDSCGEMQLLKMAVANQNKKEAQFWITSMLKVSNKLLINVRGKFQYRDSVSI